MNAIRRTWLISIATCAFALFAASAASANDYCVDTACGGTKVASLEDAFDLANDNVNPDRIFLGPAVYTAQTTNGFTYSAVGPVEIIGDGRGRTILTAPAASPWVIDLEGGAGTSIHDLTVRLPGWVSKETSGLQTINTGRRVDVIEDPQQTQQHVGAVIWAGGTLEDSTVDVGGSVSTGVKFAGGGGTVRNSSIRGETGILSLYGQAAIERSGVTAREAGLRAMSRLTTISDSVVRLTGITNGTGIRADTTLGSGFDTTVKADGVTIVEPDYHGFGGVSASTLNAPGFNAEVDLTNSVIRGGGTPLSAYASGMGGATVNASYSDYDPTGNMHLGNAQINESNVSNVGDAGFVDEAGGDFRLLPTSKLLDIGDPATVQGLDLDGNPLVADGDADGTARRDLGAYELQPAPAGGGEPGGGEPAGGQPIGGEPGGPAADTQAPLVSGFRAHPAIFAITRGTRLRYTLSEPARAIVRIKRARNGRYRTVATLRRSGAMGANTIRLTRRAGALRAGRYRAVITATDAAGNRSAARAIRLRVARRRR
jgi:hypothetical protein